MEFTRQDPSQDLASAIGASESTNIIVPYSSCSFSFICINYTAKGYRLSFSSYLGLGSKKPCSGILKLNGDRERRQHRDYKACPAKRS